MDKVVEIECLCGNAVKLPESIDTDNYDGQVVCQECKSLLHIKLVKGKLQKRKIVGKCDPPVKLVYVPARELGHQSSEDGDITGD